MKNRRRKESSVRIWEELNERTGRNALCLNGAVLYLAMAALWHAWMNVFDTGQEELPVLAVLVVPVFWWTVALLWKRSVLLSLGGVVLAAAAAGAGWQRVWPGVAAVANGYLSRWNAYYEANQPLFEAGGEDAEIWGILILQFLLTGILAAVLCWKRGKPAALAVLFLPVLLGATAGKLPDTVPFWLLLGAVALVFFCCRRQAVIRPGEVLRVAVAVGLLCLGAVLLQPRIVAFREENQDSYGRIREDLLEAQTMDPGRELAEWIQAAGNFSGSGIGEGRLANLAENHPSGSREMNVVLSEQPRETVYLRAFTGAFYRESGWEEPDSRAFRRAMSGYDEAERTVWNTPFERIQEGGEAQTAEIQIELTGASRAYGYTPYYSQARQRDRIDGDGALEGRFGDGRIYTFYYREEAERLTESELGEAPELWETYRNYAEESFLEVPEGLEALAAYCSDFSKDSVEETAREIETRFSEELRYTRTPGAVPSGTDFTEYFLLENRQGFCVHFATAAVLVYRECGFPARYVEGYAIPASDFTEQEDGAWVARVTDYRAHAWAETFDPLLGWEVRDHTPGSWQSGTEETGTEPEETAGTEPDETAGTEPDEAVQNPDEPVTPDSPEPSDTPPETDQTAPDSGTSPTEEGVGRNGAGQGEDGPDGAGQSGNVPAVAERALLGVAGAAGLLAGIWILILLQRKLRRASRLRRFRIRKENLGIRCIYGEICRICRFQGLKTEDRAGGETEFLEDARETYSEELTPEEWETISDYALRAAFSGEILSREEQKKMWGLYQKFRKNCLRKLKGKRRFRFLYLLAL